MVVLLFLFDKENENGVSNGVLTKMLFDYNRGIILFYAKSQSLLSRAVYLCQFFLSSIENIVCHNLTFILHLLIH